MPKRLMMSVLALACCTLAAQPQPQLRPLGNFEAGVAAAKAAGKPVLLEFTSTGCGWCKSLDKNTLTDMRVADAITKGFVYVKLYDSPKELREKYNPRGGTPATVVVAIDDAGTLVSRLGAYSSPQNYLHRLDQATRRFEATKHAPQVAALLREADDHETKGELDAALEKYVAAAAEPAGVAAGQLGAGWVHHRKGDLAAAEKAYTASLAADQTNGHAYYLRGNVHFDAGDFVAAGRDYERALKAPGAYPDYAALRAAMALHRAGRAKQATPFITRYLATGYRGADSSYQRMLLDFLAGKRDEAQLFEAAARKRNNWWVTDARFVAGVRALSSGDTAAARAHFEEAVKLGERDSAQYLSAQAELARLPK